MHWLKRHHEFPRSTQEDVRINRKVASASRYLYKISVYRNDNSTVALPDSDTQLFFAGSAVCVRGEHSHTLACRTGLSQVADLSPLTRQRWIPVRQACIKDSSIGVKKAGARSSLKMVCQICQCWTRATPHRHTLMPTLRTLLSGSRKDVVNQCLEFASCRDSQWYLQAFFLLSLCYCLLDPATRKSTLNPWQLRGLTDIC